MFPCSLLACPLNTYMDKIRNPGACIPCGENMYTTTVGSNHKTNCLCMEGFNGPPGGPCVSKYNCKLIITKLNTLTWRLHFELLNWTLLCNFYCSCIFGIRFWDSLQVTHLSGKMNILIDGFFLSIQITYLLRKYSKLLKLVFIIKFSIYFLFRNWVSTDQRPC